MTKILVTGATGQLGSSLVKRLIEEGKDVRIFLLPKTNHPFLKDLKIEKVYGDITNISDVKNAIKDIDYIYHVAGIVSYSLARHDQVLAVNVGGTKNILDIAKEFGVKKIVVTASTAGLGISKKNSIPLNENSDFDKKWMSVAYMYSKFLTIKACKQASKNGLNVVIVSPTTIYGQGDTEMHIGKMIKKIKDGMIFAPPGGNSVVSVDDCVEGHILAMKKGESGENYILANEFFRYKKMFETISGLVDSQKIKYVLPFWWRFISIPIIRNFEFIFNFFGKNFSYSADSFLMRFQFRYFDSSKARRELGWKPKVSFEESIRQAIQFYSKNNLI